jgi:hypothetical protein
VIRIWFPKKTSQKELSNATSPDHYKTGGIETIDIIRAKLSKEAFEGYCAGNIIKYITRYNHKNGIEDVKKASVYAAWLAESLERGEQ